MAAWFILKTSQLDRLEQGLDAAVFRYSIFTISYDCSILKVWTVWTPPLAPRAFYTKYSTKGSGKPRDKERDRAHKSRGTSPLEENVLRAMVPETDFINTASIKYYVAIDQVHSLCSMRQITGDLILFFSEFWTDISTQAEAKVRTTLLGQACKHHAALNKQSPERAMTKIKQTEKSTASNALSVTRKSNAANVLLMQYSVWQLSKDSKALEALEHTVSNILPDLVKKPTNEGILAFYDLGAALQKAEAEQLVKEVTMTYHHICALDPDLILGLHTGLRKCKETAILPYQNIALFLELAHDCAKAVWVQDRLDDVVLGILKDIDLMNKTRSVPDWTPSEEGDKYDIMVTFVKAIRQSLIKVKDYLKDHASELREQHGGVQRHLSFDELMVKIGNVVDKTALMSLQEQQLAIHAEQMAGGNGKGAEFVSEIIDQIRAALGID